MTREPNNVISSDELARLMLEALGDKLAEPAFFRALLDATVYAHVPRQARSGRVRFIQFTTPDGITVLPFFSDERQAKAAAGTSARVVALQGRQLLEATRGATLMLNPNSVRCTLYPEEVVALLDHGEVAVVEEIETGDQAIFVGPLAEVPGWLKDRLIPMYAGLPYVTAAYAATIGTPDAPEPGLLIALAVPAKDAERAARATTTELQPHCKALQQTVDITTFEPGEMPDWLKDAAVEAFYDLALGRRLVAGPVGVQ